MSDTGDIAELLAAGQREISVSEFFTKNRHLLGFDNPRKALLTTIKEGVDNAIDACEEAKILPELFVSIEPVLGEDERFRVTVEDNGPGIVKAQIPKIFAKLLYGSKFHRLKMSRGQQGIGISAAGMYGQLTTGRPIRITSRTSPRKPAHYYELQIDTQKNEPHIVRDDEVEWEKRQGTRVVIDLEAKYQKGKQSVDDYLEQTAIANPHVTMTYLAPDDEKRMFERVSKVLPDEPKEIKPHPYGIELGMLIRMLQITKARTLQGFLHQDFSRVSMRVAKAICEKARLYVRARPARIAKKEADNLYKAIKQTKIMSPPTDCIVPIGEEQLLSGLKQGIEADFYATVTRSPAVYRGNPFQVETGIAYGGGLKADSACRVMRFANRVPLQYQQSSCAITKSVGSTSWRKYGLSQPNGSLPVGPMIVVVHMASVWVPFTSESKEAVAQYPEIMKEIRLALQECGRQLGKFLRKRQHEEREARRRSVFERYIGEVALAVESITGVDRGRLRRSLLKLAHKATTIGAENLPVGPTVLFNHRGSAKKAGTRATAKTRPAAGKKRGVKKKAATGRKASSRKKPTAMKRAGAKKAK